ncbi:meiosis-specific with OB domain-containing protein [Frankliniella occidentalis]|uniref:Meiosis-specific with OB domain-containing protein n=1 Tax=Frankliniella occidentalis TaxID=133901 RepID=A0A6J1THB8_FRAOC|nr:meiosis-specific with OB domain-containing protein [Frankliniella occidentalis]
MTAHVGVRRMVLADICPGLDDSLIVGVIIGSQSAKIVTMKKDLSQRGVWNFTLRDSEEDFANVAVWGSPTYIENCAEQFHIGDVVSVTKARITLRVTGGSEDNFRPTVSSPFQLTLTEGSSEIQHHYLPDAQHFQSLIHVPTKQSSDITPLRDISSSGDLMQGNYVNILVAVQNVQRVRQLKLQDGRQIECREIVVFDRTSHGLSVQLWDKEIIYQASQWKPRETILFIADIILKWSGYRNASSPTVNSKTIITVDPQTEDAECLRAYARAAPLQPSAIIDYLTSNITDASSIRNVLSVRTVLSRGWADVKNSVSEDEQQFTALVYAVVTHLDLHHDNVVQLKCASCNKVTSVENSCSNLDCPVEQGSETFVPRRMFNIRIDLSDHTGTLKGCRLTAETAETVLGCTVLEFGSMSDQQKDILKWNFLMERCAARILVLKASHERRQPYISLISCSIADTSEVAAKIPIL